MTPVVAAVGTTHPYASAGVLLDLIAIRTLGAQPVAVVAGVSAQDARRVLARGPVDPATIAAQFAALDGARVGAFCVGALLDAAADLAEVDFTLEIPFVRLRAVEGLPTMIAKFTTDIPQLSNWGEPLLLGPGSIHVAHTPFEKLAKKELREAVELYIEVAKRLLA